MIRYIKYELNIIMLKNRLFLLQIPIMNCVYIIKKKNIEEFYKTTFKIYNKLC